MNSVEIIVGHSWTDDVRFINSLRPNRPSESSLNLLDVRDIIDIVIDGTNLTASIPEEAIFGLMGSLLASVVALVENTSRKAIIEFHHEPWELVLVPDGDDLQLSLYSVDRRQKVITRNLPINARSFIDALCEVAEEMLTELLRVSERFSADQQVRQISQSLSRLKRARRLQFESYEDAQEIPQQGTLVASTSSPGGLTLGYQVNGSDLGLQHYRGEHVFDLHALLFEGVIEIELGAHELVLSRRYPFLAMSSLLQRARQLLTQLENKDEGSFHLDQQMPHLQLEVHGEGGPWRVRAFQEVEQEWLELLVTPADCLDAMVSLGELFAADLLRTNPHLEVNQRFVDLGEELEKLRHWYRDLCGNNLYHDRPEDYIRRVGDLRPADEPPCEEPDFPWPLTSVHALFPRQSWELRAERIDFSSLTLGERELILSTRQDVRCIDPVTGDHQWSHDRAHQVEYAGAIGCAGNSLIVSDGSQELTVLRRGDGVQEAVVRTDVEWRTLAGTASYGDDELMVASSRSGELVGFDRDDGQVRWRHSSGPGRSHTTVFGGPLICVQSSEGVLAALNPRNGEILWKIRTGGTPESPVAFHQGRIYALTHDQLHQGSTIYALYPFTGRSVWQVRLPGFACGPPSFIDHWMILPVERHGQILLLGLDLEAVDPQPNWQIQLSSAGVDRPTAVLPVMIDEKVHGLIRTDRAELTCFRINDGVVIWRVIPASETLLLYGNLPLFRLREAVVNVSSTVDLRHLKSGKLLHSFSAIEAPEFGFLAAPFSLLLGEQAPLVDDIDQLTAFNVDHFLAVVP